MKCKQCQRDIADNSIYCNWCGTKQIDDGSDRIPVAKKLPSGAWRVQVQVGGYRKSFTAETEKAAVKKATMWRESTRGGESTQADMTLRDACNMFIAERENILSPSTVLGYKSIVKNRLPWLMKRKVSEIDSNMMQSAINDEAGNYSPKTVKSAAFFVSTVLDTLFGAKLRFTTPPLQPREHIFLEPEQIPPFIEYFRGKRSEAAVLLGLHSLRCSEIFGLSRYDINIKRETIHVHRSVVWGDDGNGKGALIEKSTTKTYESTRTIPILIPRLKELTKEIPMTITRKMLYDDIADACADLGIPNIGIHGLRHSFASLAAHLKVPEKECQRIGGWKNPKIMRDIYTHVAESDRNEAHQKMRDFFK